MSEVERRFTRGELRAEGEGADDKPRRILGYAAVFNSMSEDLGGFREMIEPGAFANTIREDDVRGLFNHEPTLILGRSTNGTLILVEDDVGLRYEIVPPETRYAEDLFVSIDRGDVDQSSFSFRAVEESWREPSEDQPLPTRILREVQLFDVSPVTFPAYPTTTAQVRDMAKSLSPDPSPKGRGEDLVPGGRATDGAAGEQGAVGRLALRRRHLELKSRE
jgi:HK97 family phage prohead protease